MPRPVIGITVDYNDNLTCYESPYGYATAVEKAGGLPLLLPYRADASLIPHYVDLIDGMLFSGGNDLDPAAWGETYHPKTAPIDPLREKFERALMAEVEKRRTPTLGICLGSQLMNVYRGGSMQQFLPEFDRPNPIEHRKTGGDEGRDGAGSFNRHTVVIERDSSAAKAIGKTEISANTSHKQGMGKIGKGLRVIAKAPDGIVEGLEDPTMPLWVGVQWHPERLHEEAEHLALFRMLVERASKQGVLKHTLQSPHATMEPPPPIDDDLACLHCGYNLRSLTRDDVCPECALPVWSALKNITEKQKKRQLSVEILRAAQASGTSSRACMLVLRAVRHAILVRQSSPARRAEGRAGVHADEICEALREVVSEMVSNDRDARSLLASMKIKCSEDVGRAAMALVREKKLEIDSDDFEERFAGVFTLESFSLG